MIQEVDRQALEAFLLDNPELAQLEALLDEFNIFEAIGAVRHEVRHSDFLAFLLSPKERHGLDALFAQQLLLAAVQASDIETNITAIDLALWELDNLQVMREWQHIDILLLDETHQLAVIIENKVDSGEHSQQLLRYWRTVQTRYPGWHILGIFLTPDGRESSDVRYIPLDYALIHDLVNDLTESRASTLGADVLTLMRHYAQMLRRHIMPDSDIAQLAQQIYKKHQRALDLIFEHRPDMQVELREFLEGMIQQTPDMILDHSSKTSIRYCPQAWDTPVLFQGSGYIPSRRILLFEFDNRPDRLQMKLIIFPGLQTIRERLYELAQGNRSIFVIRKRQDAKMSPQFQTIYVQVFLQANDFEGAALDELTPKIQKKWNDFVDNKLPKMTAVLQSTSWLWEDAPVTEE